MADNLRATLLPTAEPYEALGFPLVNSSGESFDNSLRTVTGNDAIVDWVFIELRDITEPMLVVATRSALLQGDGDIVDTDGISPLTFSDIAEGDYHIAIKHRNHLGVMTQNPISLGENTGVIDFSDPNLLMYGTNARNTTNGVAKLWSGDATGDSSINAADRSETWNERNQSGYLEADVDLDGSCNAADRSTTWNNRNKVAQLP